MKGAIWAVVGILGYLALIFVLFCVYPDPGTCMNLSYLPC